LSLSLSLSYCFQSLSLVCSSSHELLILGISVRILLMQWFPLAFCMIVFRHTVGLVWTSDQPVSETSICTGQHNIETQVSNIHGFSGIRKRDPSNQAAADLHLRPRSYRGRHILSRRPINPIHFVVYLSLYTQMPEYFLKMRSRPLSPTSFPIHHSVIILLYALNKLQIYK
jgi:hypothetical protein